MLPKTIIRNKPKSEALFKIAEDAAAKVPRCPQSFEDRDCTGHEPEVLGWTVVDEADTATLHRLMPQAVRPALVQAANGQLDIMQIVGEFRPNVRQLDDVAMLIALNGGTFVDAGPGCGKTRVLLPRLEKACRELNPDVVIAKVAPTYVAAKQMGGGVTWQAAAHRNVHNRFDNAVVIVGEVSMINVRLMERLAPWDIMGLKFVFMGDFSRCCRWA